MKLHRNEKYFKWGLTAFLVIVAGGLFWLIFSNLPGFYQMILDFLGIISPLVYGCLFAYLMNPIMQLVRKLMDKALVNRKLSDKAKSRLSTTISVVTAVITLLALLYALIALIVPSIVNSLEELLQQERLERYGQTITTWINDTFAGTEVEEWFHKNLDSLFQLLINELKKIDIASFLGSLTSSVYSVVMGVFNAGIGIIAAVYILIYKKRLCAQSKKIVISVFSTKHADRIFEVARRTNKIFGGYVIGKLIDALLVGILTYIFLLVTGMPYAPLIATLVGVTNIIPFFGPFLGAIPSALLLLIEHPIDALYFCIFILALQMIDGNIIENRILGEKLGISDLWVLVAILVFGGIFGFAGMLLGVPVFAVIYTLINDRVNGRLKRKRYPTDTDVYYSIKMVEDLPVEPAPSYSYVSVEPAYDMHADPDDEDDEDDFDE